MAVQRIVYYGKPAASHPDLCEWETASLVIFLKAESLEAGLVQAGEELRKRHWQPIRLELHTPVEEHLARRADKVIVEAYDLASAGRVFFQAFHDTFSPGQKREGAILSPALGEQFIDEVVKGAGGRRLSEEEIGEGLRNADYLFDGWVFELKILKEEGLEKPERQRKLAQFYSPEKWGDAVTVDPDQLSDDELASYLDIVGGPIQKQIKSASKQIRQTKAQLAPNELRGGLIFMNTGYGSLPPSLFERLVDRYVRKDSTQIDVFICISVWVLTNGFDGTVQFKVYPVDSELPVVKGLQISFEAEIERVMTQWVRSGMRGTGDNVPPMKPVSFEIEGRQFNFQPEFLPLPWDQ